MADGRYDHDERECTCQCRTCREWRDATRAMQFRIALAGASPRRILVLDRDETIGMYVMERDDMLRRTNT